MAKKDNTKVDKKDENTEVKNEGVKEEIIILKDDFLEMRRQYEEMKGEIKQLKKNTDPEEVADLEKLPRGFLKKLKGQVVVGWVGKDEEGYQGQQELVEQNGSVVGEIMIGHYKTLDGEDLLANMRDFSKSTQLEKFRVHEVEATKEGRLLTISFDNPKLPQYDPEEGKEGYKILEKFINP